MNREQTNASGIVGEGNGTRSTEVFYDSQPYFEGESGEVFYDSQPYFEEEFGEEFYDSQPYFEEESSEEFYDSQPYFGVESVEVFYDSQPYFEEGSNGEVRIDLTGESIGTEEIEMIGSEAVHEGGGEIEMVDNEAIHQVGGEIETIDNETGNQGEGRGDAIIQMVNHETSNQDEGDGGVVVFISNSALPWFHEKGSVIFASLIVCVLGQVVFSSLIPWYTNYRHSTPPPPAFVFPLSPSPSFPPSLPLSSFSKYHDHAVIIGFINFGLSGLALVFVLLTLAWKERRLNEMVGTKDMLRLLGYLMIFVVRFGLLIYAVLGGRLNTIDLTCIPFVMELISNFLEMHREAQQPRLLRLFLDDPVNCWCFIFLLILTLAQGMISAYLPWTNHQTMIFPILNCALAALMLVIAVVWFYLKSRRDPGGSMKEKMRVVAYSIVFAIRVGIVIYAAIAKSHGLVIYSFDLSCFPFLCELHVIYLELKSPPVHLPIAH